MSRVAKCPIIVPPEVQVLINKQVITISKNKTVLRRVIHNSVNISYCNNVLKFINRFNSVVGWAQAGTARSLVFSMIIGVTEGFCKKLHFSGVGYRVSVDHDNVVSMSIGYSHLIKYLLPLGIVADVPSPNEIVLKGSDKQLVGQVAANLRSYRVPELYKGKGIRYDNEIIKIKEAKKK
ncbi:MAG: 50S ribosomal protein L6 [Buchnera aphidicola (Eriosoma harunire)]